MAKTLTPAQQGLLTSVLSVPTIEERRAILQPLGLACDNALEIASVITQRRLEMIKEFEAAQAARYEAVRNEEAQMLAIEAEERDALASCVEGYTIPVEPTWFTPQWFGQMSDYSRRTFTARVGGSLAAVADLFNRMNRGVPVSYDEQYSFQYLESAASNRDLRFQLRNVLRLADSTGNGKVDSVAGYSYEFTLRRAKEISEWAMGYWKGEHTKTTRTVRHDGETHEANLYPERAEIGCQMLAKGEIARLCALMGWAGFPKMTGPQFTEEDYVPKPKPRAKRSPTPRQVRKAMEPA